MTNGDIAYFGGDYVPLAEARVPITTHSFNYGTGCFEGIRAYWNTEHEQLFVMRLADHMRRLVNSARILKLDFDMDVDELVEVARELLARNEFREDAYLRPIVYKSEETIKVALTGLATGFCMYAIPMGAYLDIDRGLALSVSAWRRIDDNAIPARAKPTGAYINAAMASDEAGRRRGRGDHAHNDGHVPRPRRPTCSWWGREMITPEVGDDIRPGSRATGDAHAQRRGLLRSAA